ncbi:MAG: DUF1971 domain-containing protein [Actinobacteria bacterium]|nr:DUF1971 domain-containing protein [Actinomycetota bacterium]
MLRGRLEYHVRAPFDAREILTPGSPGVVLPEVEHRVAPLGQVEFFVEFWRRQSTAPDEPHLEPSRAESRSRPEQRG